MEQHILLTGQRNDVLQLVKESGLNPKDFVWLERKSNNLSTPMVTSIRHNPTGHYLTFDRYLKGSTYYMDLHGTPGNSTYAFDRSRFQFHQWPQILDDTKAWVSFLSREIATPDFWENIRQEKQLFVAATSSDFENTLFSTDEQSYISSHLKEIHQFLLATQPGDQDHQDFVESRLKYLEDSAKRLGRKDWLGYGLTILLAIVMELGLSNIPTNELFQLFKTSFQKLLTGLPSIGLPPLQ